MPGFLDRFRRLTRTARRELAEGLLREALQRLDEDAGVARLLSRLGADGFVVSHYTFDEPELVEGAALMQFTYHLAESRPPAGAIERDEVRGSGIARVDDDGRASLEEVDAELYRLVDDEPETHEPVDDPD